MDVMPITIDRLNEYKEGKMSRKYRRVLKDEDIQQRRLRVAEHEESPTSASHETSQSSPHDILNLQRTIGNRAVQRFIVQRDPKPKADTSEKPSFVASITGAQRGKFQGTSRIVGHEGKIEVLGLQFKQEATKMIVHLTKRVDESSPAFMVAFQKGEPITTAQFISIRYNADGNVETGPTFDFSDGYVTSLQFYTSQGVSYEAITLEFDLKKEKE